MKPLTGLAEDLALLVEVVEAGGFSAASERCGIPKSRLSRRIARLEQQLGVELIQRDPRHFEVTEIGRSMVAHGAAIRESARLALGLVQEGRGEPTGTLRVACPVALAAAVLARFAAGFVKSYPRVSLEIGTTTGMVESLAERFDILIHPAAAALPDSNMVARPLHLAPFLLVSAPGFAPVVDDPMALAQCDVIGWQFIGQLDRWHLVHVDGRSVTVPVAPRLVSDNLLVVREAALAGWGIAPMSNLLCADDIAAGRLQVVLPGWSPPPATLYAIYPSRRSLSMAGRAFIDGLESYLKQAYQAA